MQSSRKSAQSTRSEPHLAQRDLLTRLVRARPLFLAAAFFLLGCMLERMCDLPVMALASSLALLLLLCIPFRRSRLLPVLLILAMLPFGALRFGMKWHSLDPLPEQKGAALSGRICEIPAWKEDTQRCICVIEDVCIDGAEVPGRLRLYLRSDEDDVELLRSPELGQRIVCSASIWQGDAPSNPGQFDFDAYLRLQGLSGYATAKIEDATLDAPQYRLSDQRKLLIGRIGQRIDRLFPEHSAIARAFLIGDRSTLSEEERSSFSDSGAAHLLAISGMHISILAGELMLALRSVFNRRRSFGIVLLLLLIYGALLGFSASLTRAILMFAVFGAAPLLGRYSDAPTRLAAALLAYLLVRPIAILDVGFVLSYGASTGILLLTPALRSLLHLDELLHRRPGHDLRARLLHRPLRWIAGMVVTSLAAQLAILPAVVHAFGAQPLFSILVNLVAVPLAMLGYIVAIVGVILGFAPVAQLADGLFGLLTACVRFFGELPLSTLRIARFPMWLTLLCAAACLLSSNLSRLSMRVRRFLPLTILLAALLSNGLSLLSTLGCSVVFLDAGQADCAVIRSEGRVYLVDAGDRYSPAADYLSAMNYELEAVFLSHPHADHVGGLAGVLEVCTPKRIYISPNWDSPDADDGAMELLQAAVERGSQLVYVSAGDEIALSDKTLLRVLSPAAGILHDSANEDSMILRLEYGDCACTFTGDAPAAVVTGLIGDCDVLKVGHHGSAKSVSASLLTELSPSVAVIPVGENNYGHPAAETLELLELSGSRICRTDECGAVTCRLRADGDVKLYTMRSSEASDDLE